MSKKQIKANSNREVFKRGKFVCKKCGTKKQIRSNFRCEVLKRDKHTCKKCKKKSDNLDAHHITDRNYMPGGGYVKENGITLCEECHAKAEKHHATGKCESGFNPFELYNSIGSSLEKATNASQKLLNNTTYK